MMEPVLEVSKKFDVFLGKEMNNKNVFCITNVINIKPMK